MSKRVLLVEGKDDQHVMWNLFEVREIPQVFAVECPGAEDAADSNGGIDRLLEAFPRRLLESDLQRLAVVLDANDKGPAARWDAIRQRLVGKRYEGMPKTIRDEGTVFDVALRRQTPRSIRFGVWIMPDNRSPGMIEDFVARLIREDDDMLLLVDRFLESIPKQVRRFGQAHRSKARVHTWLSVSERPGRPMGQAIASDKHVNTHHPMVQRFLDWIRASLID